MTVSTGSIADDVRGAIDDIPTSVDSGTNIQNWIEKGKIMIQNYLGVTISNSDVPEAYQHALFNIGCAYTLAKMVGAGLNFNVSLGSFTSSRKNVENPQLKFHIDMLNTDLKNLYLGNGEGGAIYAKVNG